MDILLYALLLLLVIIMALIAAYIYVNYNNAHTSTYITGGRSILNRTLMVIIDERNFKMGTLGVKQPYIELRKHFTKKYPVHKNICFHIVTKNTNCISYKDEMARYKYDGVKKTDYIHICQTLFNTEKISRTSATHHLRGRDDLYVLVKAIEMQAAGYKTIIISNDNYRDILKMFAMPSYNVYTLYGDLSDICDRRHIEPARFKYLYADMKSIAQDNRRTIPTDFQVQYKACLTC